MGQAIGNAANALVSNNVNEARAKEQLELVTKLADARLDMFENKLRTLFSDNEPAQKATVPGSRALRFERHVVVDAETTPGEGVSKSVDEFCGASDTGAKGEHDRFKEVVKTSLSAILGDTSAGENYRTRVFVYVKKDAFVRVDVCIYKYTFIDQGVIGNHKNILAYILCTSVIDPRHVTLEELMDLASESTGDEDSRANSGYEAYLHDLINTWGIFQ